MPTYAEYRAKPITQRDGSSLASSNCRMASIATGLDFHTLGVKTSTGAKMRRAQDDQVGGTDAGDAMQAWARGYDETLDVENGKTWGNVTSALQAGHLVHIDVWHASVGGPCLSGTGRYGHTMVIAPESRTNIAGNSEWLVADPWCLPARWSWTPASKLKAGAEAWGAKLYATATAGGRSRPTHDELRAVAKQHMTRYHAGGDEDPDDPPDTGGAQSVAYTITRSQAASTTGDEAVGIYWNPARWKATKGIPVYLDTSGTVKVTTLSVGTVFTSLGVKAAQDSDGKDGSWRAVRLTTGGLVPGTGDAPVNAILWARDSDFPADSIPTNQAWDDSIWTLAGDPDGRYPTDAPDCPPCPTDAEIVAERDAEWEAALTAGESWPSKA